MRCSASCRSTWHAWKLSTSTAAIVVLIVLNLRGVRESVLTLVPIFIAFVVTHGLMIVYALTVNAGNLADVVHATAARDPSRGVAPRPLRHAGDPATRVQPRRWHVHRHRGGENGLQILRGPKVETGKRTMRYMSISLAFTAGGTCCSTFLLIGVRQRGRSHAERDALRPMTGSWVLGGFHSASSLVMLTLLSRGGAAVRRRAGRLPRRASRARQHGDRLLGADAVRPPFAIGW